MGTISNKSPFRLSGNIVPRVYNLDIIPDLVAETFSGNVKITLEISKKTNTVFLHAKDLVIITASIKTKINNKDITLKPKVSKIKNEDIASFGIDESISGKAELEISYTGKIRNDMRGFYISKYEKDNKKYHLGMTQFEAIDARSAFPCFDEPNMKAVFNIAITVDQGLDVISNTELTNKTNSKINDKLKITYKFKPTPKMSTYLLAWCIGNFEKIEAKTKNNKLVSIYTTIGKKNLGKFSLETAVKALDYFEQYFGVAYPLEKLDLLASPDFASGAMENWGLITFRETCLLVDNKETSLLNKQWVALVVAHEIAHQWFGNLVTMEWWDDLWLNEGFANYIEYLAIDSIYPKWNIWEEFTQNDMSKALHLDALNSSHPIEVPIQKAEEIDEIFDDITYRKGASVIRMIAEYVGAENFKKGIRSYMKKYKYQNTKTKDLWKELEIGSKKPVQKIMSVWTKQAGFPVLEIENKKDDFTLKQKRHFRNSSIKDTNNSLWYLPIDDGQEKFLLSNKKNNNLKLNSSSVILNFRESNLIHFSYPEILKERQKLAIKNNKLNSIQKMGLLRNTWAMVVSGNKNILEMFELIECFKKEKSYIVISEIWQIMLESLQIFAQDKELTTKLKSYYKNIFSNFWDKFSWEAKSKESVLLSSVILSAVYKLEFKMLINEALEKFRNDKLHIEPSFRLNVYKMVVRYGTQIDKKNLKAKISNENLHEENIRIVSSFISEPKEKDILKVLEYYTGKNIRKQDIPILISRAVHTIEDHKLSWEFVKQKWEFFKESYGKGGHLFSYIVSSFSITSNEEVLKDMQKFLKTNKTGNIAQTCEQTYEKIESNKLFFLAEHKRLKEFLKNA